MFSLEVLVLVFATFFVAGIVKGTVGLGLPIVVLVFLAVPLGIKSAIALMLIPAVVTNFWQAIAGPSLRALLVRLWSFLLPCILGIWFGVSLHTVVSQEAALIFLGSVLAIYSLFSLSRSQIHPPGRFERALSPIVGGIGGVIFGVTGTFIVPGVVYVQALGLKKDDLVQALGITFVVLTVTLLGAFFEKGFISTDLALLSCAALIPTGIGLNLGQRVRHRVSEQLFRTIFFWVLLFVGQYFVVSQLNLGIWTEP